MKTSNLVKAQFNNKPALYADWIELCNDGKFFFCDSRVEDGENLWETIETAYTQEHRHYHDLSHIGACLVQLDQYRSNVEISYRDATEIAFAIWFHDIVYDTHANDNEEQSAVIADGALTSLGVIWERARNQINTMILATKHATTAPTDDDTIDAFLDIDLSILGEDPEIFQLYEDNVKKEYSWVPDEIFRAKRAEILDSILKQPLIYRTEFYLDTREVRARLNLIESIAKLKG